MRDGNTNRTFLRARATRLEACARRPRKHQYAHAAREDHPTRRGPIALGEHLRLGRESVKRTPRGQGRDISPGRSCERRSPGEKGDDLILIRAQLGPQCNKTTTPSGRIVATITSTHELSPHLKGRWLYLFPLLVLSACRNEQASEPALPLTAEQRDRKDLLRQPMPGWQPENAPRKLNILLLSDRSRIRAGATFHYRLEMQNVGREPLLFREIAPPSPRTALSAAPTGINSMRRYREERRLSCPAFPRKTAKVQAGTAPAREPESGFEITFSTGRLSAHPRLRIRRPLPGPPDHFPFRDPGIYRLKAVYASKGGLRAVSNTVILEVVP